MKALSDRHQRFVAEYLVDCNASAAYKRAGYSAKGNSAEVNGARLLRNAQISAAIAKAQTKVLDKLELTAENVLRELTRLVYADVRNLVDADGNAIPIQDLSDEAAACIVGLEWKDGIPKYKLADKNTALGNALKVLGLLREKVEVTDTTPPEQMNQTELARRAAFLFAKASHEAPRTVQ